MNAANENIDRGEIAKFSKLAEQWWDPSGPLKTLHAINPLRLAYIGERAELAGAKVLDVGCGAGILSEALAASGADVTGIDRAGPSLHVAARHAAEQGLVVDYRECDAATLADEAPGAYDVVTCLEVLEHVPSPAETVADCARLVRPGGSVFFSTINRNPKSFLLAIVAAEYVLGLLPKGTHEYARLIRPAELARWCRSADLTLRDVMGLHMNPLTQTYRLGGNVDVNYFCHATRSERP
jgi:2-polyprenyl-6-hydroxyphenyl methylase/3-demethylubiquinone-9 3-methyltransferase